MACDECKVEALLDGRRVLVTIRWENVDRLGIHPETWDKLYRCRHCGAYWDTGYRSYEEVSSDEARRRYPSLFPP